MTDCCPVCGAPTPPAGDAEAVVTGRAGFLDAPDLHAAWVTMRGVITRRPGITQDHLAAVLDVLGTCRPDTVEHLARAAVAAGVMTRDSRCGEPGCRRAHLTLTSEGDRL